MGGVTYELKGEREVEAELMTQGTQIQELLGLKVPAVAIAFRDTRPCRAFRGSPPLHRQDAAIGSWQLRVRSSTRRHRITIPVRSGPIPTVWICHHRSRLS